MYTCKLRDKGRNAQKSCWHVQNYSRLQNTNHNNFKPSWKILPYLSTTCDSALVYPPYTYVYCYSSVWTCWKQVSLPLVPAKLTLSSCCWLHSCRCGEKKYSYIDASANTHMHTSSVFFPKHIVIYSTVYLSWALHSDALCSAHSLLSRRSFRLSSVIMGLVKKTGEVEKVAWHAAKFLRGGDVRTTMSQKNGSVAAVKCEGSQKNATDEKPLIFHQRW